MTKDTPSPSVPGAMAMTEEQQILIEAFKLRYGDKGHYEATALIGFLEAANLVLINQSELTRLRAQVRECESRARELLTAVKFAGETMWGPPDDRFPGYEARVPSEFVTNLEAVLTPQPAPTGSET